MKVARIVALVACALIAACSGNPIQRDQERLARFEAAAGEPVDSFRFFNFHSWTPLGREHLAVWTRPNEAWLLAVRPTCQDLDFATRIALTSSLSRVYARFDSVVVGPIPCRISSIRPIDVAALRELQKEARDRRSDIRAEQRSAD